MIQTAHAIAIQETPLFKGKPLAVPAFTAIYPTPTSTDDKISVCTYINNNFLQKNSFASPPSHRGDIISVNLFCHTGPNTHTTITLTNCYNRQLRDGSRSIHPLNILPTSDNPTITVGDLNIHNPATDPARNFSARELRLSQPYMDTASRAGYSILNTPGTYTRISLNQAHRNGVIDIAFSNHRATPLVRKWLPLSNSSGSDHRIIAISLALPNSDFAPFTTPNWALTNWNLLSPALQNTHIPSCDTPSMLDDWFDKSLTLITDMVKQHTPPKTISKWSKKWWTPDLSQLRTIFHSIHRAFRKGRAPPSEMKAARNAYFNAIKKAKQDHWNAFIANADTKDVWRLKKMANRTEDKIPTLPNSPTPTLLNNNLINAFFPPRPEGPSPSPIHFPNTPLITPNEVQTALGPTSNLSAPGPDTIPYSVWKGIHRANPRIIPALLNPLIQHGYHPLSLKTANGVILAKPNKPDYSSPAAYRIIVLLQTFSKILEKIITLRLAVIAKAVGLLHNHQCGSVSGLSTGDAVTTLIHETRAMQLAKLKVSTLFLDIKGGFDHVLKQHLASTLSAKHTPPYITNWVLSFLSDRYITLLFKGSPKIPTAVQVGVPQGSPISPLLFLIYINFLHQHDPAPGISLSYVDDLAITVASPSYGKNIDILQAHYNKLTALASPKNVTFSVGKTELMHWRTPRDKSPTSHLPILLDGQAFQPSPIVRWVGYWLSPNFNPNAHFIRRTAAARAAFGILNRFSSAGKGLSPANCRKVALLAIRPMLTYGANVFTPTSALREMNTFWNAVLRWTTGCFRATNNRVLSAEAKAPPLILYLHFLKCKFAIRILRASPLANPVTGRTDPHFPTTLRDRTFSHTALLRGRPNPPKKWNSRAKKGVAHTPIEHLCSLLLPLIEEGVDQGKMAHRAKQQLLDNWCTHFPTPTYYTYRLDTSPLPFTHLHKFIATRIHQIRSGKSYLRAQQSWINLHTSPKCRKCGLEDETPDHAILQCNASALTRSQTLEGVTSLEEIWDNHTLTLQLGAYITKTRTGYPVSRGPSPLESGSGTSSPLSSVSSSSTSSAVFMGPIPTVYAS
ncbi:uncharacterized protein H6S33_010908 [Morchella sextelata]|uniref:uncharacterized protein n=1 Tax=Morchella sextelata TaxID=1174677 RepID=UPI001D05A52D|nr:uncharacterized protein H6S33_010908 [Morchella sextelata]KAH0611643.1 hypothetical protein H6S33_010908 [Morchella sextelata]